MGKEKLKKGKGKKKHNYITVLTHLESGEGNSNNISFPLFSNSDISFPSCLGEEKPTWFPKKYYKVSPIIHGEKSDILEKFPIFSSFFTFSFKGREFKESYKKYLNVLKEIRWSEQWSWTLVTSRKVT